MNEEKNLVSIVIPFYNGKEFIKECLESILNQTYKNIEIIVVNDCSPNIDVVQFLKDIQSEYRFKLITHGINIGTSGAICSGIKHATGNFICFLGQDDLYDANKIAKQIGYFQEKPDLIAVYTGFTTINQNTGLEELRDFNETTECLKNGNVLERLYQFNDLAFTLQSLMIKKTIATNEIIPLLTKLRLDDWSTHIYLFQKYPNRIGFIEEHLTKYRIHPGNSSSNKYRIFSMTAQVIAELIPEKFQKNAMIKQLEYLGFVRRKGLFRKWKI